MSSYPENLQKTYVPKQTESVCPFKILDAVQLKDAQRLYDSLDYMYQETADVNRIPKYSFHGYHVCDKTWNDAHRQAWLQGWHHGDPNEYIFWYMNQFHDIEIIQDFHYKYLKRILSKPQNPETPETPKLTFTEYCYGMLVISGGTTDGMDSKLKLSNADAIRYLERMYVKYFSPQNPKKDFNCKAWIEIEKKRNNVHMHVVYQRKANWLFAGKGFLKPSKKGFKEGLTITHTKYSSDLHILNGLKYNYDDSNSEVIKDLCHEIKQLS